MKSCFFIGHREALSEVLPALTEAIEQHIVEYGVTEFIVGNYGGFDHMAAKTVIAAKNRYKCLKHYRNQYIHSVLDRNAALELLAWGEAGVRAPAIPVHKQQYLLKSLEQILQISGIHMDIQTTPILAEGPFCKKKVVVYPAMWNKPIAEDTIYVSDSNLRYAKPYAVKSIADNL